VIPCFSLRASKLSPVGNGTHRENFASTVHATRNVVPSSSCTTSVFVSTRVFELLQYASKFIPSQFFGTSPPSTASDRVSEFTTFTRISLLRVAAFARDKNADAATIPASNPTTTLVLLLLITAHPPDPAIPADCATLCSLQQPRTTAFTFADR